MYRILVAIGDLLISTDSVNAPAGDHMGRHVLGSAGIASIADVPVGFVQLKAVGQERLRRAFGLVQLLSGVSAFGMLGKLSVVTSRSSIVAGASLCR